MILRGRRICGEIMWVWLRYTAYLAELAMDQDGGGSLESDDMLSSDAREAHT